MQGIVPALRYRLGWQWVSLMLLGLWGCSEIPDPPSANEMLHLLHQQDAQVRQVEVQGCQRYNPYEGQEGAHPLYDTFECRVAVERQDAVLHQSLVKLEDLSFGYDTEQGWILLHSRR